MVPTHAPAAQGGSDRHHARAPWRQRTQGQYGAEKRDQRRAGNADEGRNRFRAHRQMAWNGSDAAFVSFRCEGAIKVSREEKETTMSKRFFGDIGPVRFEGLTSDNPYAYRHYDPSRVVMGKTMAEHLRPAVCYWHNFAWMGTDMFGAPTFERPWDGETMKGARAKADVAFDMFSTLGFPFFTYHDRDVVPEGDGLKEFG